MIAYLIRRLLQVIPVLVIAAIVVWAMEYALPGSPAQALAGQYATPAQVHAVELRLGLGRSLPAQFWAWIGHAVHGDLGTSFSSGKSVTSLLVDRIPATAQLTILSMLIGMLIAVPLGVFAGVYPNSPMNKLVRFYQAAGIAVPTFWLGLLFILLFSLRLGWLPALASYVPFWRNPLGAIKYTILPATTIAIYVSAILTRFVCASMEETFQRDFVRTARAKGLPERRVIRKHVLRNALLPTVTVAGVQLGTFLGGTVVVEVVFNYPGLGRLIYTAVSMRDYSVIQGAVLFIVLVFLLLNIAVDVLYSLLDPRIRLT